MRVCVCVRARGRARVCERVHAHVRVALLIQHATRMRRVVTSFVVPLAPPYISTLSQKPHDFRKKLLSTKGVF